MNKSSLVRAASAALAASLALSTPARVFAQGAPASPNMQAADKAAKAKDWATALKEYRAANAAQKSAAASEGIANALYELKELGDAYDAYDALLKDFGATLPAPKKKAVEARFKELGEKTGGLAFKVNEDGAEVSVDDKPVGKSPIAAPLRLTPGPHRIKVSKDGFLPVEQAPNVAAGAVTPLDVTLSKDARKARLVVKEASGMEARVVIDGTDVGKTPFEGEVEAGSHTILIRTSTIASAPQTVELERAKTKEVVLDAKSTAGRLEIRVHEGQGAIFLDGKEVGQGTYAADIPAGKHTLEVRRDGYEVFTKDVNVGERQTVSENVTMQRVAATSAATGAEEPTYQGIYGGFGLGGAMLPGGTGNDPANRCTDIAASCDKGSALGAGAWGYIGYSWNPIGLELMLGGMYDQTNPKLTITEPSQPNPSGVAHTEEFKFLRAGGFAAIRTRATFQTTGFRVSVAGGVGLSYKKMFMERDATSLDGVYKDTYSPDGKTAYPCEPDADGKSQYCDDYWSPALNLDASIHWRIAKPTSIMLGFFVWLENAGSRVRAKADPRRFMANQTANPPAVPITTLDYQLASSMQLFMGPYLGMQFGPL